MDRVWTRDGEIHSPDSVISGLSVLDDDTDDFGRMVLQHARDEQRMNQALSGRGQAFRKARPAPRIGQALEAFEWDQAGGGRDSPVETWVEPRAASAGSSNDSEPPLNIPRDWGRKGRHTNGWLRRMRDTESSSKPEEPNGDTIYRHRTTFTGDESPRADRLAAAERLNIPTRRSNHSAGGPQGHSPKVDLLREQISSIERVQEWDVEQDLTAASLLASTPAVPSRVSRVDESRRREIQTIERRGIATSRIDRISQRTSSEALRRTSGTRLLGDVTDAASALRPATLPELRRSRRDIPSDKENMPFAARQDDKVSTISNTQSRSADVPKNRTEQQVERPMTDSLAMLRRLARGLSKSPSPSPSNHAEQRVSSKPEIDASASRSRQAISQAPEVVVTREESVSIAHTPATTVDRNMAKTPIVTGAWIDTPGPKTDSAPSKEDLTIVLRDAPIISQYQLELPSRTSPRHLRTKSDPVRASSALADLVRSARAHPSDNAFGDDTIASLEDLLDPTLQVSDTLDLRTIQAKLEKPLVPNTPASQADKNRGLELQNIDSMDRHLKAARTSIKDAKSGLKRFERDIDAATASAKVDAPKKTMREHCGTCSVCGRRTSVFRSMWSETCSLFYAADSKRQSGIRLTWLGTICATLLSWYIVESTLGYFFTPPLFASSMVDFGVDPNAPRWPFVLPTLIFRPFRWLWHPLLQLAIWLFGPTWKSIVESVAVDDSPAFSGGFSDAAGSDLYNAAKRQGNGGNDWYMYDAAHHRAGDWDDRLREQRREMGYLDVSTAVSTPTVMTATVHATNRVLPPREESTRASKSGLFGSGFGVGNVKWWRSSQGRSKGEAWDEGVLKSGRVLSSYERESWTESMGDDEYV